MIAKVGARRATPDRGAGAGDRLRAVRRRPSRLHRRVPSTADVASAVYQLTCSPLHNRVPPAMRLAFRAGWSRVAERGTRVLLGVIAKVPPPSVEWTASPAPSSATT